MTDNLKLISQRILEKSKQLRMDPGSTGSRIALIACGGNMRGTFGAGVVVALEMLGLSHVFDTTVGVSAGAGNIAYLLAEDTVFGASMYYNDLIDGRFIKPTRLLSGRVVDLDFLERRFRETLNVSRIKESRSKFFTVATKTSGEFSFLNATDHEDPIRCMKASMAIPVLYNYPVEVNGDYYFDGAASQCMPVKETIDAFNPTDILVILNEKMEHKYRRLLLDRILTKIFMRRFPAELRKGFLSRDATHNTALSYISMCADVNVAVISPDYEISKHSRDRDTLREFVLHGAEKTWRIFSSEKFPKSEVLL